MWRSIKPSSMMPYQARSRANATRRLLAGPFYSTFIITRRGQSLKPRFS